MNGGHSRLEKMALSPLGVLAGRASIFALTIIMALALYIFDGWTATIRDQARAIKDLSVAMEIRTSAVATAAATAATAAAVNAADIGNLQRSIADIRSDIAEIRRLVAAAVRQPPP